MELTIKKFLIIPVADRSQDVLERLPRGSLGRLSGVSHIFTAAVSIPYNAISLVKKYRGGFGSVTNRIFATVASLGNVNQATTAAESNIRYIDVATETAEFTWLQVLHQAGAPVLAHANKTAQPVTRSFPLDHDKR